MENLKLHGSKNVRDLGGIPVEGGVIKFGRLLRGGHLQKLNKSDIEYMQNEIAIKTVIDLRTDREIARKPDVQIPGAEYIHFPFFNSQIDGISYERPQQRIPSTKLIPDLVNLYPALVSEKCIEPLKGIIHRILNLELNQFPVLFHCTEGKDRTGVIAMLLLSLLGANREEIYKDYMFTNVATEKKSVRYYRLVKYLRLDVKSAKKLKRIFLAEEQYLDAAYSQIEQDYGTVENFL